MTWAVSLIVISVLGNKFWQVLQTCAALVEGSLIVIRILSRVTTNALTSSEYKTACYYISQVLSGLVLVDLAVRILNYRPLDFVVCFLFRFNSNFFFSTIDVKKMRSVTLQYGPRTRLVRGVSQTARF